MREIYLNLARRAYVNTRPVVHLTVALALLGLLLTVGNIWLYGSYFRGSGAKSQRLTAIDTTLAAERARISEAQAKLAGLDLGQQNATAAFLNRKIADRAFSWSRLMDRLATLLPTEVRLVSLAPDRGSNKERTSRASQAVVQSAPARRVMIAIAGEAKDDEAILTLVDRLFADPAFQNPDPRRETRGDDGVIRFDLAVEYLPEHSGAPPAAVEASSPAAAAPESDAGTVGAAPAVEPVKKIAAPKVGRP